MIVLENYLWLLKSLILGPFFFLMLFTSTTCVVVEVVGATVVVVVGTTLSVTKMGFLGALEAVEEGTFALLALLGMTFLAFKREK